MKIVDRNTFLAMPAGVLFSKYAPHCFDELLIKMGTITAADDFYYSPIVDAIKHDNGEQFGDLLEQAHETGFGVVMDFYAEQRDGMFDKDQLFAVWEEQDIQQLITRLYPLAFKVPPNAGPG